MIKRRIRVNWRQGEIGTSSKVEGNIEAEEEIVKVEDGKRRSKGLWWDLKWRFSKERNWCKQGFESLKQMWLMM
ncbi:hypothetical protein Patl1_29324 [Pistacia atlantica]|uniref:Uncharacterized protein n=1 Tax=Pistacia atlantica TaxID=434234 RepID=A0ACC1BDR4_9ROSI|nr:hypothetical protein Patl1_29324 [Pistacia atlantica]